MSNINGETGFANTRQNGIGIWVLTSHTNRLVTSMMSNKNFKKKKKDSGNETHPFFPESSLCVLHWLPNTQHCMLTWVGGADVRERNGGQAEQNMRNTHRIGSTTLLQLAFPRGYKADFPLGNIPVWRGKKAENEITSWENDEVYKAKV